MAKDVETQGSASVNVREIKTGRTPPTPDVDCGAAIARNTMERFVEGFEKSSRRWEIVVYPAMAAFILLSIYGFYLIYSLTRDLHLIAQNMGSMNNNIEIMTTKMDTMDVSMSDMSGKLDTLQPMLSHMQAMDTSMEKMDRSIQGMEYSTRSMSYSNDQMRHAMQGMNHSVGRPMSIMNSFMPW
jgi:uncharacterized protein YoxC